MSISHAKPLFLATLIALITPGMASAATFTYALNGTLDSSTGGPALTSDGGTLRGYGYSFGPNQGLTLASLGGPAFSSYAIDIDFSFTNDPTVRNNGYRKILDFSNLSSDAGLYTLGNTISLYPSASGGAFSYGTRTDLRISRSAAGLVDVQLGGTSVLNYDDSTSQRFLFTNASPLHFFEDDLATSRGEAGTGFVSSIVISTDTTISSVPLPPALPMFGAAVAALAVASYRGGKQRTRASDGMTS